MIAYQWHCPYIKMVLISIVLTKRLYCTCSCYAPQQWHHQIVAGAVDNSIMALNSKGISRVLDKMAMYQARCKIAAMLSSSAQPKRHVKHGRALDFFAHKRAHRVVALRLSLGTHLVQPETAPGACQ